MPGALFLEGVRLDAGGLRHPGFHSSRHRNSPEERPEQDRARWRGPEAKIEEEAEKCFRQEMEIAGRQQARLLELRAAMSLARLLEKQGHRDEARTILAEIYGWFTEGFDTADLKDAKALLDELAT